MTMYYLATTGSNAANGLTPGTAWQTFAKADDLTYAPGDVLMVASGTYNETVLIEFKGGGNAANPVLILASDPTNKPLVHFGTSRTNSNKFNVCGDGFWVQDIKVTQTSYTANTPADRQLSAQIGADGSQPSDVTFFRCDSYNSYEALKASGVVQRIRFIECSAYNCQIGIGIAGAADDCEIVGCLVYNFKDDGIQTKGGCRNPLVSRNTVYVTNGALTGISLGGASTIYDGTVPAWWRDEGYESTHALAVGNLVVLSDNATANMYPSAITFAGSKFARSANNTLIRLTSYAGTGTYSSTYQFSRNQNAGSNWTGGNPYPGDVTIENDIVIGFHQLITANAGHIPQGSNILRNITVFSTYDNLVDEGYTSGTTKGVWTIGLHPTRNPLLTAANLAGTNTAVNPRLQSGSSERLAGAVVTHPDFSGSSRLTVLARRDYYKRQVGTGTRDRGCSEDTVHRKKRTAV